MKSAWKRVWAIQMDVEQEMPRPGTGALIPWPDTAIFAVATVQWELEYTIIDELRVMDTGLLVVRLREWI